MVKIIYREQIINIYTKSTLSMDEASKKIGCSVGTLRRWMKIYNIKSKGKVRYEIRMGAKYSILGNVVWLKKQLLTKSFRDIAEEVGTTEGNISDRVKRYGLRPKNWSHSLYVKSGLKKKYPNGRYGKLASNWKGGKTTLYNLIRESLRNKQWMKSCLKRDRYTCQWCGQVGGDLEVDHKKQLALIIKENNIQTIEEALYCNELWDINNGRTLCISCHKKTKTHSNKQF